MSYGPYRIQPEGRAIEVGEESQFLTGEREESPSITEGQGYRTQVYRCEGCGCAFKKSRPAGRVVRHCSKKCREAEIPYWVPCSKCHAAIGFGQKKSRQLLGKKEHSSIFRYWKANGIIPAIPKSGSWRKELVAKGIGYCSLKKKPGFGWWGDNQVANGWMEDYEAKLFDWSSIWWSKKALDRANAQYSKLTEKQRRERNAKIIKKRCPFKQRQRLKEWKASKRQSDPAWNVAQVMRSRLSSIMKSNGAPSRSVTQMEQYIGCSLSDFRNYLESKFTKRMNWENYGMYWHVDHILPVSRFDHSDRKQIAQCWHFTNLEPLDAKANVRKGAKITNAQMSLLL